MTVDKRAFDALEQKVAAQERKIATLERAAPQLPTHSINDLPKAIPGRIIFVPDATAGAVLAIADGNGWLELQPVGALS